MSADSSRVDPDDVADVPEIVPLTMAQRAWLLKDCVPAGFFIVALIAVPWVLETVNGSSAPRAFYAFMALVIVYCLYSAQQRARDLLSGVAMREEDLLMRTWRSKRQSNRGGEFERLGRMRCTSAAYGQGRPGTRHVVTYSPVSRIVWSLEPIS